MGMTDKKVTELLDGYEKKLQAILPIRSAGGKWELLGEKIQHALGMVPKMRGFLADGRREKVFRWLGFLQCVFWMIDAYTVQELADHSRPTKNDLKEQYPGHSFDAFGCAVCSSEGLSFQRSCKYAKEYLEASAEAAIIEW